jgi:hypothetical protein
VRNTTRPLAIRAVNGDPDACRDSTSLACLSHIKNKGDNTMLKRIGVLTLITLAVLCVIKYYGNSQVEAQAGQISHVRIAGCTAGNGTGTCTVTGTWSTAFLDTNYTATCTPINVSPSGTTGGAYSWISSKTATQVTVILQDDIKTSGGSSATHSAGSFDCIAIHD